MKNIAFLTSGGDSPGMNACIRAIVKTCLHYHITPYGISNGYQGLIENEIRAFAYEDVNNIIQRGGTLLGTARSKQFTEKKYRQQAIQNLKNLQIDALIVIGGDGSFKGAEVLSEEADIPVIGLPGTIDNDIYGTDRTIGYDTALNTVIEAVDRIRDTANSHHRFFFIEVMGRHAGFIALNSALAAGAEMALIPETKTDIPLLAQQIKELNKGKRSTIVLVAEGDDEGDSTEIIRKLKPYFEDLDVRNTVLGHIQRGGTPSAADRILATRLGSEAVEALLRGERSIMIGAKGDELVFLTLKEAIKNQSIPMLEKMTLLDKLRTKS